MLISYFKRLCIVLILLASATVAAQSIIVNNPADPETAFSPEELISNVLVDGCSTIQFDFLQENPDGITDIASRSWGYFRRDTSSFPFEEGIILSTGYGTSAQGPNDSTGVSDSSTTGTWNGDADLETILNNLNGDTETTNNATVFEFRFTSVATAINFDFIFASEEYEDQWECDATYRDGFVFLIRGPGIPDDSGTAFGGTNLALVPNLTNIPISTGTIHMPDIGGIAGSDCDGQVDGTDYRSDLYISNSGVNNTNEIQFDGFTDVLTAVANVVPGEEYTMKMVIADRGDTSFDSAVFLRANSFNLGGADLGADIDICDASAVITDNGGPYTGAETYQWFYPDLASPIPGETAATITVTQSGTYYIVVTDGSCQYQDSIEVDLEGGVAAGDDGLAEYCPTSTPFNLFDQLGGSPDTGGSWTGPSVLSNGDLGTFDPATNTAGIYTYTVTLVNNGVTCTDTAIITVTPQGTPSFTVITNDPSVCGADDGSIVIAGLLANVDYAITYTDDGLLVGPTTITSDGVGNVVINGLDPGTYSALVVDAGGCIGNDAGPFVLTQPPFTFTVTPVDNTNCLSASGMLVISDLAPNKEYELSYTQDGIPTGPVLIAADANGEIIFENLSNTIFSDITVTCVSSTGCTAFQAGPFQVNDLINFTEDFGTGLGRISIPFTNYTFNGATQVNDGEYAVNSDAGDLNTGWHTMEDHTTGDTNGRMFVVNASVIAGEFYRRTIAVIENTSYDFSAWITGVYDSDSGICGGTGVPANVTFRIEDLLGNLIDEVNSGDIQNGPDPNWEQFTLSFNSVSNTAVQLVLLNNGSGGCGNDLAIDDISLIATSIPLTAAVAIIAPDCTSGGDTGALLISGLAPNTAYDISYDYNSTAVPSTVMITDINGQFVLSGLAAGIYDNLIISLQGCASTGPLGPFEIEPGTIALNLTADEPTACFIEDGRFIFSGLVPGALYTVAYSIDGVFTDPITSTADSNGDVIITNLGPGVYTDFSLSITSCFGTLLDVYEFPECSIIPQGISPNNDGLNDSFEVSWLQATNIKIFNRYGAEVYELANYRNEWFGTTNDGEELPVGTYFYVIELPEGAGDPITGWVYVNRAQN